MVTVRWRRASGVIEPGPSTTVSVSARTENASHATGCGGTASANASLGAVSLPRVTTTAADCDDTTRSPEAHAPCLERPLRKIEAGGVRPRALRKLALPGLPYPKGSPLTDVQAEVVAGEVAVAFTDSHRCQTRRRHERNYVAKSGPPGPASSASRAPANVPSDPATPHCHRPPPAGPDPPDSRSGALKSATLVPHREFAPESYWSRTVLWSFA